MSEVLPECPTIIDPGFYLAGLTAIEVAASRWNTPAAGPVMVLGHNPGWENAASTLSRQRITMTTGNAVLLEGQGDTWLAALRAPWRLETILLPRALQGHEPT
jgi:phosphohistidine phosphatase SixA